MKNDDLHLETVYLRTPGSCGGRARALGDDEAMKFDADWDRLAAEIAKVKAAGSTPLLKPEPVAAELAFARQAPTKPFVPTKEILDFIEREKKAHLDEIRNKIDSAKRSVANKKIWSQITGRDQPR